MRRLVCLFLAVVTLCGCSAAEVPAEQCASGVTYEIFVRSFQDSDGDGVGDLAGVTDRLDYIASLGVSRIWLTPIFPSPSYHKYDVTDYRAVDSSLGTTDDLTALVAACGEKGIGVLLDLPLNHTSREHPWFQAACKALREGTDSPYIAWYVFTQGSGQHPVEGTDWFYEGQFGDHMPDLNLDNPEVRSEIAGILTYWQGLGVKGFRLDAVTSYYTGAAGKCADFLRFVTENVKRTDPNAYVVGEAWADEATILNLYASGIDSLFNFPAADQEGRLLKSALKGSGALAAQTLADWNARVRAASPASQDAPFLTNHDMGRSAGVLRGDLTREKIAASLYLLLPGAPTVYYGEELGMTGSGRDENKRLPMLWSAEDASCQCLPPPDADQAQRLTSGADAQDADEGSLLNHYRALIALRRTLPELADGVMTPVDAGSDAVACWQAESAGKRVLIAVNASAEETVSVTLPEWAGAEQAGSAAGASWDGRAATLPPAGCLALRPASGGAGT